MAIELIKSVQKSNILEFGIQYKGKDWSYYEYIEYYTININPSELQKYEDLIQYIHKTIPIMDVNYNADGIKLYIPFNKVVDDSEEQAVLLHSIRFYDENGAEYHVAIK